MYRGGFDYFTVDTILKASGVDLDAWAPGRFITESCFPRGCSNARGAVLPCSEAPAWKNAKHPSRYEGTELQVTLPPMLSF